MKKILFVGNVGHGSTFIDNDYKELQKYFSVRYVPITRLHPKPDKILKILKAVMWCDVVYGWFASYRMIVPTIFAKILGKKIVVVAGGYDVVNAPEINYGAFIKTPDRWVSKFVFKNADIILPVSNYIANELIYNFSEGAAPMRVIYNGVKVDKFYPQGEKADSLVITVGEVNRNNLKRKGIEDFVKTARLLPEVEFVVIGGFKDDAIDYLRSIATPNVCFTGYVTSKRLLEWYQAAKVYAQLSYHEGFGLSVAEAMLCKCIPVTTDRGALPEVTGNKGITYGEPQLAAKAIKGALLKKSGTKYRRRVLARFPLKKRINKLRRIFE